MFSLFSMLLTSTPSLTFSSRSISLSLIPCLTSTLSSIGSRVYTEVEILETLAIFIAVLTISSILVRSFVDANPHPFISTLTPTPLSPLFSKFSTLPFSIVNSVYSIDSILISMNFISLELEYFSRTFRISSIMIRSRGKGIKNSNVKVFVVRA
ncbi:153aa long hypothetical protein [Pyrococcus horikoshii OT3]|uniref:Uncharacterized protein n=1 Tax=Pyrococcus horikoshii (strain ATCC 700860 / DSM 12428 / JCM 9974 / NBRC 100139 / OT-3) TaxID=70601 RepID=O57985_PYRHO|nr:153aa long hypothetical protein [Pyrococcus horikoshii OT3]